MPAWDDAQYLAFGDERTRAARELLSRVTVAAPRLIVDLGCGPGNSTQLLHSRYPESRTVGVDNSDVMLSRARADFPDLEWVAGDAATYEPDAPADVLFANAVLQWLPNHGALLPRLMQHVRPGGVLALQMPCNFDAPSHRSMRELGAPWTQRLSGVTSLFPVEKPAFYYDVLSPLARSVDIWSTTYEHVMPDVAAIVEWVKGTGLRPYLAALSDDEHAAYLDAYAAALDVAYPRRVDGKRLFSFTRLFIVATR